MKNRDMRPDGLVKLALPATDIFHEPRPVFEEPVYRQGIPQLVSEWEGQALRCRHEPFDDRGIIICSLCDMIIDEEIFVAPKFQSFSRINTSHDSYSRCEYLRKKANQMTGFDWDEANGKAKRNKATDLFIGPKCRQKIIGLIKDCTSWREVRKILKAKGFAGHALDVPRILGYQVNIPSEAIAICSCMPGVKFEFVIAKLLRIEGDPMWKWVPCWFSKVCMKKYEWLWKQYLKGARELEEYDIEEQARKGIHVVKTTMIEQDVELKHPEMKFVPRIIYKASAQE